ncbi:Crp/Fnr family transcriptional regulator [Thalassospira sp.]|uniref:Crp/Fnr family transcriptional regulator n=1 Tax=Thalassospira sp. TaxID=1912094 RepID=UPI0027347EAE|nr:Crp/Fnr family transcriptional regulator [Thalassospira sp.]MDP2698740.1 Crp/Fnr family transcriptional regulator [Thalassospira sp.]
MTADDAIYLISDLADRRDIPVPANCNIAPPGPHQDSLFVVESGLIMQCNYDYNGDRQVCRVYRAGDVIGLEGLAEMPLMLSYETLVPSVVHRVPLRRITGQHRSNPALQQAVLHLLAHEVVDGYHWKINIGAGSATRRVCRFLLWTAQEDRCVLPPRDKLGSIIVMTTETASRIIATLRRKGILHKNPGYRDVVTIDRRGLLDQAGDFRDRGVA